MDQWTECIPDSNGSSYYQKANLSIGIVTDEYMYNYYKDAVNLIPLTSNNYKDQIDNEKMDLIMYISCWNGMSGANGWRGEVGRLKAAELFGYAKENNIKTIFQTIEDPSNYDVFLPVAKVADYIFTSCEESVDAYKRDTNNTKVYVLEYGVNPLFHNPIGFMNKERIKGDESLLKSVFFAGSWAPRYKERCVEMGMIFDAVLDTPGYNLIIADRNRYIKGYDFPSNYEQYTIAPIEHAKLQKVHKLFPWTININSIKNSRTMCAMRIYEVQALGGLLISNYALAVSKAFPNIFTILDGDEVKHILRGYTREQLLEIQIRGIRNVMTSYTVFDRLNQIFQQVDLELQFPSKKILAICDKKTPALVHCVDKQIYKNIDLYEEKDLDQINQDYYDYVVFIEEGSVYSRYYLQDLVNAFKYVDVAYVTYHDNTNEGISYNFVKNTQQVQNTMYDLRKVDAHLIKNLTPLELSGFEILFPTSRYIEKEKLKKLAIIIPVYNNGVYLRDRCISSLIRSTVFDQMQLYIIDDGSTDEETRTIVEEMQKLHPNVTTYFFEDGGSGSASRPRNKGIEICREPYVAYLDPDNEAIQDGYAKLLKILEEGDVDLAFGTILKVTEKVSNLRFMPHDALIESPRDELKSRKFKTQSIQACVAKKELIVDNHIISPHGAIGQDTLFFYEMMLTAKNAYHITLPIHIYYAQREDSVVNTIDRSFFEKFLLLEEYQVEVLKKYNVFEQYAKTKFPQFHQDWYLEKLKLVEKASYPAAAEVVSKIVKLYEGS